MIKPAPQCSMFLTNKRHRLVFTVVLVAFVIIYLGLGFADVYPRTITKHKKPAHGCFNSSSDKERTLLVKLTHKIHTILDSMGIQHWLMYDSLWGPLRGIPGPLPWDYDVKIGINAYGNFSKVPFVEFNTRLTAAGLKVTDNTRRSGNVFVEENEAKGNLFIFYNHGGVLTRTGYETWIFFINHRLYHSFPALLVKQPLPLVRFGYFNMSVPRGGIEIMKYLYPFSWWKEMERANCQYI